MGKSAAELINSIEADMGIAFEYNVISGSVSKLDLSSGDVSSFDDRDLSLINSTYGPMGYGNKGILYDHISANARAVNPVADAIEVEEWDGLDHIGMFSDYIKVKNGSFEQFIRPWMIGVVAKIYRENKDMLQNPVLILLGAQGAGKSSMVKWLSSLWPQHAAEMILSLGGNHTKDSILQAVNNVVIELAEFQATLEASSSATLKSWITMETATFRAPYGRTTVTRNVHASYIATANRVGAGLLSDPSGSRRYRIIEIESIDWEYESVDVCQMWAQALDAYRSGETYDLCEEAQQLQVHNAERMMVPDIVRETIEDLYEPSGGRAWASTGTIYRVLREAGLNLGTISAGSALVADAMRSAGYEIDPDLGYPVKKGLSKFGGSGLRGE